MAEAMRVVDIMPEAKVIQAREGWIQCGFCYGKYKEEQDKVKKDLRKMGLWVFAGVIICEVSVFTYGLNTDKWMKRWGTGNMITIFGVGSFLVGGLIGMMLYRLIKGSPPEPDRYKVRNNPYREKLLWKLDNEGKPIKEGSNQINKYGMILDPERDK